MTPIAPSLDQLVTDNTWLRRLARSLVADDAAAADLVHETYLAAVTDPPPDDRPLGPWLVRVMRNLASNQRRSARRRLAREAAVEQPPAPARPDEIASHVETQRQLAGLVLELPTPQRDVVLLHFFEGLTSVEIGRRLDIPAGTVRWRLKQALDTLRDRLDERSPRRTWLASLAAMAGPRGAPPAGPAVPGLLVAIAVAVLAAAVALYLALAPREPAAPVRLAAPEPASRAGEPPQLATAAPAHAASTDRRIRGIVVDADHHAVAGAAVRVRVECRYPTAPAAAQVTAADGSFEVALDRPGPGCSYRWFAAHGDRVARFGWGAHGEAHGGDPDRDALPDVLELVLGPDELAVLVSDATTEAPIAGAQIAGEGATAALAVTGGDGIAHVRGLGDTDLLFVRADGHVPAYEPVDWRPTLLFEHAGQPGMLEVSLAPVPAGPAIAGIVVDEDGRGTSHDELMVYRDDELVVRPTRPAPDGTFRLWVPEPGTYELHYAGSQHVAVTAGVENLRLVAPAYTPPERISVDVTVLDAHGRPAANAEVSELEHRFAATRTDAAGHATVAGYPRYAFVLAGAGDQRSEVRALAPDAPLVLHLRATTIAGTVVDPHGAIAAHALIRVHRIGTDWAYTRELTTDDRGSFAITVPDGSYAVSPACGAKANVTAGDDRVRLVATACR